MRHPHAPFGRTGNQEPVMNGLSEAALRSVQQLVEQQRQHGPHQQHPEAVVRQVDAEVAAAVGLRTDAEYFGLMVMLRLEPARMATVRQCREMLALVGPVVTKLERFLLYRALHQDQAAAHVEPDWSRVISDMVRQAHLWGVNIQGQLQAQEVQLLRAGFQMPVAGVATPPSTPTRQG